MTTTVRHGARRATTNAANTRPDRDWRDQAACREVDPELFFPAPRARGSVKQVLQAKRVCARCPVREVCLEWALDSGQHTGVWGGLSEDERGPLARVPESGMERCMNRQGWIEAQLAGGRSFKGIARELDVDPGTLGRAVRRFAEERVGTSGLGVAA